MRSRYAMGDLRADRNLRVGMENSTLDLMS